MRKVLKCSCKEWNLYIDKLPMSIRDIYYRAEYYRMQEKNGDGVGNLFVFEDEERIAVYPFMLNEIKGYDLEDRYYDIETAYGYGGPVVNCKDKRFIEKFEKSFNEYCIEENIVAEFIRFHPLIKNQYIFKENIDVSHNRYTVYIDLNKSTDEIWENDIISKNRNMIRKAIKSGLKVDFDDDINSFKEIYKNTMDKVSAEDYYYFNDKFYDSLKKIDKVSINVKLKNEIVASAIFLKGDEYFHYHLSGSIKEYLKYSPNNLMLWEAIKYAKENGFKIFHFGGGLDDSINDKLFKFKKSFGKGIGDFYIGKRIHNSDIYNYLINTWEVKNNKKAKLFLQYKV